MSALPLPCIITNMLNHHDRSTEEGVDAVNHPTNSSSMSTEEEMGTDHDSFNCSTTDSPQGSTSASASGMTDTPSPADSNAGDTTAIASVLIPQHHHRTHSLPHQNDGGLLSDVMQDPGVSLATMSSSAPVPPGHPLFMSLTPSSEILRRGPFDIPKISHRKKSNVAPTRPPRPPNAWILYRSSCARMMSDADPFAKWSQGELSKLFATRWRAETPEVKREFVALAEARKAEHALLYAGRSWPAPVPLAGGPTKTKSNHRSSTSTSSFDGFSPLSRSAPFPSRISTSWAASSADSSISPMTPADARQYVIDASMNGIGLGPRSAGEANGARMRWESHESSSSSSVAGYQTSSSSGKDQDGTTTWPPAALFNSTAEGSSYSSSFKPAAGPDGGDSTERHHHYQAAQSIQTPAFFMESAAPYYQRSAALQNTAAALPQTHLHPSTAAAATSTPFYLSYSVPPVNRQYLPTPDAADPTLETSSVAASTLSPQYPIPAAATAPISYSSQYRGLPVISQTYWSHHQSDDTQTHQRLEQARHYAHIYGHSPSSATTDLNAAGATGGYECSMESQQLQLRQEEQHHLARQQYYQPDQRQYQSEYGQYGYHISAADTAQHDSFSETKYDDHVADGASREQWSS